MAPPYGAAVGFATPEVVAIRGLPVLLVNSDTIVHNVESIDVGPDVNPWCAEYEFPPGACPLFRSDDIGVGRAGEVFGMAALEPGRVYAFVCSYHGRMRGNLRVLAP